MVIQKQKKHDNGFESDIKRKIVKQSVLTSTEWYAETIMRTKKMVWLADSRITRVLARNTNACVRAATTADSISCSADALRPNVFSKSLEDSMASNHPSPTYLLGITIYRYLLNSIHPIQMSVYIFWT
jgi:hypothetical protein